MKVLASLLPFQPLLLLLLVSSSSIAANNGDSSEKLVGTKPDPWVSAAPLIVAAVCSDGVALVALHSTNATDTDDVNWLETHRESLRIQQIDGAGTALICAGWRTDAEWLASKCRSLVANHVSTFGAPSSSSSYLPQDASLWMASCASSNSNARPLSVVGLLATSSKQLNLVDATGSYAVRAHAVGRGARRVNAKLRQIDFSGKSSKEGVQCILNDILVKLSQEKADDHEKKDEQKDDWKPLHNHTRIEIAFVDASMNDLQRIRQPFLVAPLKSAV